MTYIPTADEVLNAVHYMDLVHDVEDALGKPGEEGALEEVIAFCEQCGLAADGSQHAYFLKVLDGAACQMIKELADAPQE